MDLRKLRALSHVWRWNYHPRVRQESVAEHSYWTMVYTMVLLERFNFGAKECDILKYALFHDAEEAITGDLPGPVKRGKSWDLVETDALEELDFFDISGSLPPQAIKVVKAADLISALVFADEEVRLGNTYFKQIRAELLYGLKSLELPEVNILIMDLGFDYADAREYIADMSHL